MRLTPSGRGRIGDHGPEHETRLRLWSTEADATASSWPTFSAVRLWLSETARDV